MRWWISLMPWVSLTACLTIQVKVPEPAGASHESGTTIAHVETPGASAGTVHLASTLATNPTEFFSNMRQQGMFFVTDPFVCTGGAKGDDTTDDTSCFTTALSDAQAIFGRVELPPPSVAYKITNEIPIHWPATVEGVSGNSVDQTIVRAHGSMRSLFELRPTFGLTQKENGNSTLKLDNFTIDANGTGNATYGVICNGCESSELDHVRFQNARGSGYYEDLIQSAPTISSVTYSTPGSSPHGLVVATPNPNYVYANGTSTTTAFLKITTGGSLGSAQYETSWNGGSTYQSTAQTVAPVSNVAVTGNANDLSVLSGLQVQFQSGTYAIGDTYSWTVTYATGDFSTTIATNGNVRHIKQDAYQCGSIYATTGASGPFGGYSFLQTVSGTVATNAGSPVLVGTGTSWTSILNSASGRVAIKVPAAVFGNTGAGLPGSIFASATVLDDTHIQVGHEQEPASTASGLDYALLTGGGTYEDGTEDTPGDEYQMGTSTLDSIAYQTNGRIGNLFVHPIMVSSGVGVNAATNAKGVTYINPETDSGVQVDFLTAWDSAGLITNPTQVLFGGAPTGWNLFDGFHFSPVVALQGGSWLPTYGAFMQPSTQSLATAGTTIVLPALSEAQYVTGPSNGLTSWINLQTAGFASMTLTGTPTIQTPYNTTAGQYLVLFNGNFGGNGAVTFTDNINTASRLCLGANVETLQPDAVAVFHATGHAYPKCEWDLISISQAYGNASKNGNGGDGLAAPTVTTSATPTSIWYQNCVNNNAAPGSVLHWDVSAESDNGTGQPGTLVGFWRGTVSWDTNCNNTGWHVDVAAGNGTGGAPPNSWTVTHDNASPFANLLVTGDTSGHNVHWMAHIHYADPGQ